MTQPLAGQYEEARKNLLGNSASSYPKLTEFTSGNVYCEVH